MYAVVTAEWRHDAQMYAAAIETRATPYRLTADGVSPAGGLEQDPEVLTGRLIGRIRSRQPEQWLVLLTAQAGTPSAVTVVVDRLTTMIDEDYGPAVDGAWLDITALPPAGRLPFWRAQQIRVDGGPQIYVEGEIDALSGAAPQMALQVGGAQVLLAGGTVLNGRPTLGRYAIVRGTSHGLTTVWASEALIRYRFDGVVEDRFLQGSVETWIISVPSAESRIDSPPVPRVYLQVDATSQVSPSLVTGAIGAPVNVQVRAAESGWLADWILDLRGS